MVGHVVATITQGAAAAKAEGPPPAMDTAPKPAEATPAPAASTSEATTPLESTKAYQPSIKFPPRRTPTGEAISMLPAEQQRSLVQHGAGPMQAPKPRAAVPRPQPRRPAGPLPPPRTELSDREMELIMLGGAE